MAIALVGSGLAAHGTTNGGFTSGTYDTSAANLLVAIWSRYTLAVSPTFSDSKSNTWAALTSYDGADTNRISILYVENPTVDSAQTFTVGATGAVFGAIVVFAFSGAATSSPYDSNVVGTTGNPVATLQPGSLTPSSDNQVVVCGLSVGSSADTTYTIDSSFATVVGSDYSASKYFGCFGSYLIQGSAAAVNPAWSWTGNKAVAATQASFKAAAGGATRPVKMAGEWGGYAGTSGGFAG